MTRIPLTLAAAGLLLGCTEAEMPGPADGRALFVQNCAVCHGADAAGGGTMSAALTPAPPDLTRIALRNDGTFPAAQVMSTIDGYTRTDTAAGMPEFGALLEGDLVPFDSGDGRMTPTPRKLVALLEYLRSVQVSPDP